MSSSSNALLICVAARKPSTRSCEDFVGEYFIPTILLRYILAFLRRTPGVHPSTLGPASPTSNCPRLPRTLHASASRKSTCKGLTVARLPYPAGQVGQEAVGPVAPSLGHTKTFDERFLSFLPFAKPPRTAKTCNPSISTNSRPTKQYASPYGKLLTLLLPANFAIPILMNILVRVTEQLKTLHLKTHPALCAPLIFLTLAIFGSHLALLWSETVLLTGLRRVVVSRGHSKAMKPAGRFTELLRDSRPLDTVPRTRDCSNGDYVPSC